MVDKENALVAAVGRLDIAPQILDTICRATGMGFSAIARVSDTRWVACAVRDDIAFGLVPGGELQLDSTICHEIRQSRQPVVINDVACDVTYRDHHTPARYGFRSYISYPIILPDGEFFGTLCAIHPQPLELDRPEILNIFKLFAELIGFHLVSLQELAETHESLAAERSTAGLREQFIAILGHDLRNPLASVQAGMSVLEKGPTPERATKVFDAMHRSLDRMWALIDDMLDFARGRLGGGITLALKPIEVNPIISQVVAELVSAHPEREVIVALSADEPVHCDPERLSQLVSNLVGNALTHGARDKPVRIEASTADGLFRLAVANGGEQIPADRLPVLFHPFASGKERSARDGLGLGLFIASEIATAHDGALTVTSDPDETRFVFEMQTAGPAQQAGL